MVLNYDTSKDQVIDLKIGLSYTSIENAKLNLEKEAENLSFDEAKALAKEKWNDALNRIVVSGGTEESRIKFYTGLYHALLGRGLASDVNGAYPKMMDQSDRLSSNKMVSLSTIIITLMLFGEDIGI